MLLSSFDWTFDNKFIFIIINDGQSRIFPKHVLSFAQFINVFGSQHPLCPYTLSCLAYRYLAPLKFYQVWFWLLSCMDGIGLTTCWVWPLVWQLYIILSTFARAFILMLDWNTSLLVHTKFNLRLVNFLDKSWTIKGKCIKYLDFSSIENYNWLNNKDRIV